MASFHARKPKARLAAAEKKPRPAASHPPGQVRADALLVQQGLATSRSEAQRLIAAGRVAVQEQSGAVPVQKPAQLLLAQAQLRVYPAEQENP